MFFKVWFWTIGAEVPSVLIKMWVPRPLTRPLALEALGAGPGTCIFESSRGKTMNTDFEND